MNDRDKLLVDAKASSDGMTGFGMETGQAPLDEAHTPANLSFNTGALYRDAAPFGSDGPGVAAGKQDQA
ncbi:MAG TPA: hypothetical protein VK464_05750 [Symbiobacteriaceae bacterium]|jgi:hypothetical protein|nr:hypothetical protein [Symbiobacteriaceae bacterium]